MTHIIITAGGTLEEIDGVRQITNTSTGRLSAGVYGALAEFVGNGGAGQGRPDRNFTVHYVISPTAIRPEAKENLPVNFYPVTDVKSVEATLRELMSAYSVGYLVHGMAVSDFTRGYLIEREQLVEELARALEKAMGGQDWKPSFGELKRVVGRTVENPSHALKTAEKVGSRSELILSLVKTPKLIEKIKVWSPRTYLVGFKLLKNVSEERLVRAGADLAGRSGCDLVLANDLAKISGDRHPGLLIKDGRVIGRYDTKAAVARGIVWHMLTGADYSHPGNS